MKPSPSKLFAGSAAIVIALFFANGAVAKSLEIEQFDATIAVAADGTVQVEERIVFDFRGRWNGVYRDIPYRYTYPSGIRGNIRLKLEAVEDDSGNALEHWQKRDHGQLSVKVRVPGARDARRTVVLRYRAEDVVRHYSADEGFGHDEVYWNVTGNGWQVPIRKATATIRLPQSIEAAQLRTAAYVGGYGSRASGQEPQRLADGGVRFSTNRKLAPHAGLTVVIGFPPGHVEPVSVWRRIGWLLSDNWFLSVPPLLLLVWWLTWLRRGRDSTKDRTIVPQWEAPLGLRPTEIGMLIDDRMDHRDLTAAIFDLAVRGVLKIKESGQGSHTEHTLLLNEQALDGAELETFEEALVDSLFGGKSEVKLNSLKRKFYTKAARVGRKVSEDLVVKGLYRARPEQVRRRWILLTMLVFVAAIVFGGIVAQSIPYFVVLALSLPPMLVLAWQMPQRTKLGLDTLAQIRGMEEYLATAERERMERLSLHQIERLLPYAIALDLHDTWTEQFAGLFEEPPQWYQNPQGGWSPALMSVVVHDMNKSVTSNLYSIPRTQSSGSGYSGSSGFSGGGGSSGGGMGGGGGGGW